MENIERITPRVACGSTTGLARQRSTQHRGTSKLEAFHGSLTLLEDVLLLIDIHLWGNAAVFILCSKVVLNQIKGLLINLLILVALQEFNFVQACSKKQYIKVTVQSKNMTMIIFSLFQDSLPLSERTGPSMETCFQLVLSRTKESEFELQRSL